MAVIGIDASGAAQTIYGVWSKNLPVADQIAIYEGGSPMDLDGIEFEFQLRKCHGSTSTDLVCSTDSGLELTTAVNDEGNTIDVVKFDDVDISGLEDGDYVADFIMKDGDGVTTHLAHGTITLVNDPAPISI